MRFGHNERKVLGTAQYEKALQCPLAIYNDAQVPGKNLQ